MRSNAITHPWRTSLARSAVFRAAGLCVAGFVGWLWFSSAAGLAWRAGSLVAVPALAALVGTAWYLSQARVEGRWRAVLDRYAEQEQAKGTRPRRDSRR